MNKKLKRFFLESNDRINKQSRNKKFIKYTYNWIKESLKIGYLYNFQWMGIPIIKYPSDLIVFQEILFEEKPDLIIETGVAHGGSLAFLASIQKLYNPKGKTIGIEIDFRKHNKDHCKKVFSKLGVKVYEGSSISEKIIKKIKPHIIKSKKILVILDSDHSHNHVLNELELYSKFVSKNSYLICTDTVVEIMPKKFFLNDWQKKRSSERNFDKGNNPLTAIKQFLKKNKNFKIDLKRNHKSMITENHFGFLRRIK